MSIIDSNGNRNNSDVSYILWLCFCYSFMALQRLPSRDFVFGDILWVVSAKLHVPMQRFPSCDLVWVSIAVAMVEGDGTDGDALVVGIITSGEGWRWNKCGRRRW